MVACSQFSPAAAGRVSGVESITPAGNTPANWTRPPSINLSSRLARSISCSAVSVYTFGTLQRSAVSGLLGKTGEAVAGRWLPGKCGEQIFSGLGARKMGPFTPPSLPGAGMVWTGPVRQFLSETSGGQSSIRLLSKAPFRCGPAFPFRPVV